MTTKLETTTVGENKDVIITSGAMSARGQRMYCVFRTESDARSPEADKLCLGIITDNWLTNEQVSLAERNSEAL